MTAKDKRYFLVIDGNALVHRAWHALPPLANKAGLVVSGAYGFTMILLGAIRQFKPEFLAVTFDLKAPNFRHELFKEYKAQREKKPDELYAQIPLIERILEAMDVPVFTAKGFEADDVIGTLTKLANEADPGIESVIVTGDMDTLQLVDDRTKVFTLRKGMTDTVLYDAAAVQARYGLDPDQMIDYKALRGDPSDNIPGVKGIGEKTATELLKAFKTLDGVYAAIDAGGTKAEEIRAAVREKLVAHREEAMLARTLCAIRRDVPVEFALDSCVFTPPDRQKLTPIFEEYQFNRLLAQIPDGTDTKATASATPKPVVAPQAMSSLPGLEAGAVQPPVQAAVRCTDAKSFAAIVNGLLKEKRFAFRTLLAEEDPVSPAAFALAITAGTEVYLLCGESIPSCIAELRRLLTAEGVMKVCHDLKRETGYFESLGISLHGPFFDLMIASYLIHSGERRHGLEAILSFGRNVPPVGKDMTADGLLQRLTGQELPHFLPLADEFGRDLVRERLDKLNIEMEIPLAGVLSRMERAGVEIDVEYFNKLSAEVSVRLESVREKIIEMAGTDFNVNSPKQLKEVLFDRLALSAVGMKKTAKGGELSTAAAELEKLRGLHPIIEPLLEYRELAKLLSTYLEPMPALMNRETGRIHARFNQTVTATGRLSSSEPNLQNIPTPDTEYGRKVRNGFVASEGSVLLAADYSQIELRIAAHIANEKVMIGAFNKGEDIHWRTAAEMWGEEHADERRRLAKVINFGILYGMGPQRLADSAGITFMEAREYIDKYFALHQGITHYIEDIHARLRDVGFVETLFGRRRYFRNYKLMNRREQAEAERQAINMPIQGTSADIIKIAMVRLDTLLREKYGDGPDAPVKMVLQVHDELIFEVNEHLLPDVIDMVKPIMEHVRELKVPIAVDLAVGKRWGNLEDIDDGKK